MRALALLVVVTAALATAATGAVDPKSLVIRPAEVPRGFRLDAAETGVRTNEDEIRGPKLTALYEGWGRVTGYQAEFRRQQDIIGARVDVFRDARGASRLLAWIDADMSKAGMRGLRRIRLQLGDRAWLYRGKSPSDFSFVIWREGRLCAAVIGWGVSERQTLRLARLQQRRIEAALRSG